MVIRSSGYSYVSSRHQRRIGISEVSVNGGAIMVTFESKHTARRIVSLVAVAGLLAINGMAQYGGGGGTGGGGTSGGGTTPGGAATGGGAASVYNFHSNYHVGFESPEGWGLKY